MRRSLLISASLLALIGSTPASASEAEMAAMAEKIKRLESQLNELKSQQAQIVKNQQAQQSVMRQDIQQEVLAQVSSSAAAIEPTAGEDGNISVSVGSKGLEVKNGADDTLMRIRGFGQADARFFMDDDTGTDDFELRRARLVIEGEIGDFYYRFSPDFGGDETTLPDLYAGYRYSDAIGAQIGKFKVPFGLERLRSSSDTTFLEAGMPTLLTPNADVGAMVFGEVMDGGLSYEAGVFNGVVDGGMENRDSEDNKELAARVMTSPVEGLHIGVAGTWGEKDGSTTDRLLPSYRTAGRERFFQYDADSFADGDSWRVMPQGMFYRGPFGVMGEYVISAQDVRNGAQTASIENKAWGVQGVWVLSGEDATWKSLSPEHAFDPRNGQWGAWELAARYGALRIDDDAFPVFANPLTSASDAQNAGAALNWYLNDHIRITFDYEHTSFDGGAAIAGSDRNDEDVISSRLWFKF